MKKFILMLLATITMSISTVSAQSVWKSNKFFDNWSVGINTGIQTNLHDWNTPQGAVIGLNLNKDITPVFGLTFEGNIGINNQGNWDHEFYQGACGIDNVNFMIDGRVNLMNAIWGYKGSPRTFEVEALVGVGYSHMYGHDWYYHNTEPGWTAYVLKIEDPRDAWFANTGLNFNYNFGKSKQWSATVSPRVVWDLTYRPTIWTHTVTKSLDGAQNTGFNVHKAVFQLTAGLTYHFKTSNGTHHFVNVKEYNQTEVDELNATINKLKSDNEVLKQELSKKPTEVVKEVTVKENSIVTVSFDKNSADITKAMPLINEVASKAKLNDTKIVVVGYASKEGTVQYNQKLSQKRANAVSNALVDAGVNVDNITTLAKGATEEFGGKYSDNRVVIVIE